uniref:Uncharacterized protein n=1 Tax=Romanomermis culicivorax TaxID=13658 RepID=A0A915KG35_ROMCU
MHKQNNKWNKIKINDCKAKSDGKTKYQHDGNHVTLEKIEQHKQDDEQQSKENSSEIQGPQRQTDWEM